MNDGGHENTWRLSLLLALVAVVVVAVVTFNVSFPTGVAAELTGSMIVTVGLVAAVEARRRRRG